MKESNNQFKILIKLISVLTYNINLENQNIDYVNKVAKTYNKLSNNIIS